MSTAWLASYGHGYLHHKACNCLNMTLGGGPQAVMALLGLPLFLAGEGGYMGGVAVRNLMIKLLQNQKAKMICRSVWYIAVDK